MLQTGRLIQEYWLGLIPQIRADLIEIYAHPAIVHPGEPTTNEPLGLGKTELDVLLSERVRDVFVSNGFELTNYNELAVNSSLDTPRAKATRILRS